MFTISPELFERFPDYIVGWVIADIPSNRIPNPTISAVLRDAVARAQRIYEGVDLKTEPAIAVWRHAFSEAGWSASRFPASVEALVRRAVRGTALPSINAAVDVTLAAALTYLVPVGCHDRDLSPDLTVRFSREGDQFLPLGGGSFEEPDPGEVVYASGSDIRTRRWTWRQSRDGLVTAQSTRLFVPVDGFANMTLSRVEAAINFLEQMFTRHLDARTTSGVASRDDPIVVATGDGVTRR